MRARTGTWILLAAVAVALLVASPAVANVYCVDVIDATCTDQLPPGDASAAFSLANGNPGEDAIRLGAATYPAPTTNSFRDSSDSDPLHVIGLGAGVTTLTGPDTAAAQTYLLLGATGSSVSGLTVLVQPGVNSFGDVGIFMGDVDMTDVTVDGTGTDNVTGVRAGSNAASVPSIAESTINLPRSSPSGNLGISLDGNASLERSTVTADQAIRVSSSGGTASLNQVRLRPGSGGVSVDAGTVEITNSLIDLGNGPPGAAALAAVNYNAGTTPKTINARHVTIVGGSPGSIGVISVASNPTVQQTATVSLNDSVIAGPSISIYREASNTTGTPSTASVTTSYSNYDPATAVDVNGVNGAGAIAADHQTNLSPGFVDAAGGDFRLAPGSLLLDLGDPDPAGPAVDLDGATRIVDGDADGVLRRDPGAFELQDLSPPQTVITAGPAGKTTDNRPSFSFTSDEAGSTFVCALDGATGVPCGLATGTETVTALANGAHTFSVQAVDVNGNIDPSPAVRSFSVVDPPDRTHPQTSILKVPKRLRGATATIRFKSNERGSTFQCRLDHGRYRRCTSPLRLKHLKPGTHSFRVRAVDRVGNIDRSPAIATFRRVRERQ